MPHLSVPNEVTFATFTVVTSTSVFPISFAVFEKANLTVLVDGVALTQSDFSFAGTILEGGGYQGGTVTLNTAVDDVTVRIERNIAPARASNYSPSASVPVRSVDQALNRLTAVDQDHDRRLGEFEDLGLDAAEIEANAAQTAADVISTGNNVAAAQTAQGLSEAARDLAQGYASDAAGVSGVNVPSYASRASLAGATVEAAIKQIATRGYATEGDGGGWPAAIRISYADIVSAGYPSSSYVRSQDRIMPDGSTDATNGGYWALKPGGVYPPSALGAAADNVTNDAAVLATAMKPAPCCLSRSRSWNHGSTGEQARAFASRSWATSIGGWRCRPTSSGQTGTTHLRRTPTFCWGLAISPQNATRATATSSTSSCSIGGLPPTSGASGS